MTLSELTSCLLSTGILGILLVSILEKMLPGIPGAGIYLLIGLTARPDIAEVATLIVVTAIGSTVGSLCWFYLARLPRSRPGLRSFSARLGRLPFIHRASAWYAKSMTRMALAQLVPAARVYTALASALVPIDASRFAAATFLGCLVWNGALISAGSIIGRF
jgi:membrane protein DedA with SNARE-associated domain